jgi:hypothetical protein
MLPCSVMDYRIGNLICNFLKYCKILAAVKVQTVVMTKSCLVGCYQNFREKHRLLLRGKSKMWTSLSSGTLVKSYKTVRCHEEKSTVFTLIHSSKD